MPSPGFRKLTLTLTIVVIVTHTACGFTLQRRSEADSEPTTDLTIQAKSVKSLNDIKQVKDEHTNNAKKNKYNFTSELKFIDSTEDTTVDDTRKTENTQNTSVVDITTTTKYVTSKNEEPEVTGTLNYVLVTVTQGIIIDSDNTTSPRSKDTSRSEFVGNMTENLQSTESTKISEVSTNQNVITTEAETRQTALENETTSKTTVSQMQRELKSTIGLLSMNDQVAIDSVATENLTAQQEPTTKVTTKNITETDNIDSNTKINSIKSTTSQLASSEINVKQNNASSSELPISVLSFKSDFTTSKSMKHSSEFPQDTSNSASTIVEIEVTTDSSAVTIKPSRVKYTTLERVHDTSSEDTYSGIEEDNVSAKAESIQTTLPIPTTDMFRAESNAYQLSTVTESQIGSVTAEIEILPTLESINSTQSETLGTVASKRAGFLDLSKRTSTHYAETSTDKNTNNSTVHEKKPQEINKARNYTESQSQLAEDSVNEELLKEEIINNQEENAKMYEGGKGEVNPLADNRFLSENTLSVQPINQDKRTTVYTVGPNYKPMKRIEVQPTKSFVRDPDDNSWRNESISSLGIVFKPKNSSSKSFKEVLKTKTETEFNNLQDKDNKGDTPELRVRLEKIAEFRKTTKKRIYKFGDDVYTDYQEGNSAEGTNTPKIETTPTEKKITEIPSKLLSKGPELELVLPMTTTDNQRYRKKQQETISKDDIFKDLGVDILTTTKEPNKPYKFAEYYDTTDEYDADYITLPKLDLKKFTVSLKTTSPSLTPPSITRPTTGLMPPDFPERKPTVQYFPPTTKPQKVNVNDYDVVFEERIKQFTLKETPKTITPIVDHDYVVATDRPTAKFHKSFTRFTTLDPNSLDKHVYIANRPSMTKPHNFVINDGNFNRGTYVIKHYKDFLKDNSKYEDQIIPDFVPQTASPTRHITPKELARTTDKEKETEPDYEEYGPKTEKKYLNSFVDLFNQNSDQFKVDFPVLYNSSVIHRSNDNVGRVSASSSTFMKRLYSSMPAPATRPPQTPNNFLTNGCEPNCDNNITVELSPAYELHYYVPEQEEKEEMEQPGKLPDIYNL